MTGDLRRVLTPTLEIAYEETGAPDGAPVILLHGEADGVDPVGPTPEELKKFTDLRACRIIPIAGHNFPQEAPGPVAAAIEELLAARRADWSHRHDATPD